ncbi:tetratricopeptide repeat protein (plasmid) [Methanocaldococcus indicus]|uniref:tetratricopeptide repeat protein n=3 Tax=Methanocaldococcus indicus TaxID=213231 RepID=UPI003C6D7EC9
MKRQIKTELGDLKKVGLMYYNEKKYSKALHYLKEYTKIVNNNWKIYHYIGDCYFYLKDYKNAIDNYKISKRINEYNVEALKRVGMCYFYLNDYKNAVDALSKYINIKKDNEALFYLALSYAYLGDFNKSKNILNNLNKIKLDKSIIHDLAVSCYNLGKILYKHRKYSDALYYLDRAVLLFPRDVGFWYKKGEVHYYLREYDKALECFNKVLELSPSNEGAIKYKKKLLSLMKNSAELNSKKLTILSNNNIIKKSEILSKRNVNKYNKDKNSVKDLKTKKLFHREEYESVLNEDITNISSTIKSFLSKIGIGNTTLKKVSYWEEKAKEYYKKGDIDSLITSYKNALNLLKEGDKFTLINAKIQYFEGIRNMMHKQYELAVNNFETAKELFLKLGKVECALISAKSKFLAMDKIKNLEEIIGEIEKLKLYFKKYGDKVNKYEAYWQIEMSYCKYKSIYYRKKKNYTLAKIWTENQYEIAEKAFKKFKKEDYKRVMDFSIHMYWNILAKEYETLKLFDNAHYCYKKSGDVVKQYDEKIAYDEYMNAYKCLALLYRKNKEKFIEYIDISIDYAKKIKDKRTIYYLLGLKFENLMRFCNSLEETLNYLKKAINYFNIGGLKEFAKTSEMIYYYLKAKLHWSNKEYDIALQMAEKSIELSEYAQFPNYIPSPNLIVADMHLYKFYISMKNYKLKEAINELEMFLNYSKEFGSHTRKYKFFNYLYEGLKIILNDKYTLEDAFKLDELRKEANNYNFKNLCQILYLITSYITLKSRNLADDKISKKLLDDIIGKIIGDADKSKKLYMDDNIEDFNTQINSWVSDNFLMRLPSLFVNELESWDFYLTRYDYKIKKAINREFYVILEEYMKMFVEFNAKTLWGDNWKKHLSTIYKGNFSRITYGPLVDCIEYLKNNNAPLCKDIPNDVLKLLKNHKNIRNPASHKIKCDDIYKVDVRKEVLEIMEKLSYAFPICIKVISDKRSPYYECEICWESLPKRIDIKSDKKLKVGDYYYLWIDNRKELSKRVISNPKYLYKIEYLPGKLENNHV